jgi:RNA polymerase sigma factor (sigma-70 family)
VETGSAERERPRLGPDAAARKRVAVETYARIESTLRRTAHRYSLCADDVDDALQRGLEILLRRAPSEDPRVLVKWMQTVVKHEALAVRREREQILAGPAGASDANADEWIAEHPAPADGPPERAERREAIARSREALQGLKPQELRALTLLAEGYSYAEIGEITGYSRTKVNRCLAEGRERFRSSIARSSDGRRCAELQPLLSAFCDGEARAEEVAQIREHLRACAHCRSTLRAYRAAPAAAAAIAPTLSLDRSLWERAHDALANLAARLGGGGEPVSQVAGSGAGGVGVAAVAKVAAVCIGAAGGAAACVAGGVIPSPLAPSADSERPRQLERRLADLPPPETATPRVEYAPAPVAPKPEPEPRPERDRSPGDPSPPAESEAVPAEPAPVSGGAIEYAPPPAPEPVSEPAPAPSSGGDDPAGEFGP